MRHISICDQTISQLQSARSFTLTFREKLEAAKLLDKLCIDVIELGAILQPKSDALLIKSVSAAVNNSSVAVSVIPGKRADDAINALSETKNFRLQVEVPVSTVKIEYIYHKKPAGMREDALSTLTSCLEHTDKVELIAGDATRSDRAFFYDMLKEAVSLGVKHITLRDEAGVMLPDEFAAFLDETLENVPELRNISWGVACSDTVFLSEACAVTAISRGASEIKAAAYPVNTVSLARIADIIAEKGSVLDVSCGVQTNRMKRIVNQIERLCADEGSAKDPFLSAVGDNAPDIVLNMHDTKEAVVKAAETLGYDLSDEDADKVYDEFLRIAAKKETIGLKELDVIIATNAVQVPSVYKLSSYIANHGHDISSVIQVKLENNGEIKEGVGVGGGPIDASFRAIEQITGKHFELDGFQISAITEGKEATGEAIVRLRSAGGLYSGRGLSTDIIGASIRAYIIALNKILFEEEES